MENKASAPTKRPKGPPLWAVDAAKKLSRGLSRLQRKLAPPSAMLLELVSGVWRPHAIWIVAELGIADHLEAGPLAIDELARRTNTNADALLRVLRPLAHDGILEMPSPDTFALTAISEPLVSTHPTSMRQTVRQSLSSWNHATWGKLLEAVRTGEPQFTRLHGKQLWDYFASEAPDAGRVFHESMGELTRMSLPLLVAAYDFGQHARILDLGGGNGSLLAGILRVYAKAEGGVLDLGGALAEAPATLEAAGVRDRVQLIEGNVFEDTIPAGWDAYVLKHILHGATGPQIAKVLSSVREVMAPTARLVVIEMLIPDHGQGIYPAFLDLQMLVASGGRERSVEEYRALFAQHGLKLESVARTAGPTCVLAASRA